MSTNLLADLGYTDPVGVGAVQGEIAGFATDRVVIDGTFTPGDALDLRPGRRCVVLTEDAVAGFDISELGCPGCDERDDEKSDLERERDGLDDELRDAEREIAKLQGQLTAANDRIEQLERALAGAVHDTQT